MRLYSLCLLALYLVVPAFGNTITSAGISGLGTTTVTASATAFYTVCGLSCSDPVSISAGANANALTLGLVRDGFIEITGSGGGEFGNGSGSVDGYSFGCSFTCIPAGYLNGSPLPFTLGVPFQVNVGAFASNSLGLEGSGDISFHFSVFESVTIPGFSSFPGASVTVYDAASVPEPATWLLTAAGLGLLWRKRST